MATEINWEELHSEAKSRWLETERPRRSMRDVVSASVPWWILIVGLGLFFLSAPHTAGVFDQLTPGWGMVAPLTVEFGLLYAAFRRKVSDAMPPMLGLLQWLLFVTAVLVNGAGAFGAVVSSAGIAGLSFAEISARYITFPAISQAALIMAALSAVIVPVGAVAAGEGVASLVLQHRGGSFIESRWREVEREVLYRALFSKLNGDGLPPNEAAKLAKREVKGYLGAGIKPET